jgi:UDP-N-acetylmuramate dehydrogenase
LGPPSFWPASEFQVGYRSVNAPAQDEGFLAARLQFDKKPTANDADVRALLAQRKASQPIGAWSCGSVFTNPPGDHAARLIETAGLKGFRVGDAAVSEKHANFIINHGGASAAQVEQLIEHVRATVERVHGVRLTPEVRILGERA